MSILIILFAATISCFINKISGSGPVVSKNLKVSGFTRLYTNIKADIYYTPGTIYKVEVFAQQNIMDIIENPVVNGTLKLQFKKYCHVKNHERIAVFITAPGLKVVDVEQASGILPQLICN